MKNIAILVPSLTGGGAEKVAGNLSVYLSKKYNVHLIVYSSDEITYDYAGTLHNISSNRRQGFLAKIYSLFERISKVKKIKKQNNIEICISFLENANIVNIASRHKDKVFISVRAFIGNKNLGLYDKLTYKVAQSIYKKADGIIAVSKQIKEDLIANYSADADKVKAIYNSYDIEKITKDAMQEIEPEYKDAFGPKTIVTMGRLIQTKGHIHLIRAFAKLKEELSDVQLAIIGSGESENKLKAAAEDLNIENSILFVSYTDNPIKYIDKCGLYVLSSKKEGFPNALCEAMVCGLPVIAADCKSGPREILNKQYNSKMTIDTITKADYGILIPFIEDEYEQDELNKQEQMLYEAMKLMLTDTDMHKDYAQKAKQRVQDFSIETTVKQWIDFID